MPVVVSTSRVWASAALAVAFACACTTAPVPDEVQLVSLKPGAQFAALIDARPQEAKDQGRSGYVRKYLPDDAVQPRALDLVASRLGESLPESYRGRALELHRLDVGFLISPNVLPTSSDTTLSLAPSTPGSVVAAAVLVGYGLIAAVNRGRSNEMAVASIDVWIGEQQLRSARTVAITRDVGAAKALESALAAALDDLEEQALELKP